MERMVEAKQKYENIPIPKELSERVMLEIKRADQRLEKNTAKVKRNLFIKRGAAAAAAVAVLFTAGLNTSEVFAREMRSVPVIGAIADILTFRSYNVQTKDMNISVDIPSIELISEDLGGLEQDVNEEIYAFCKEYAEESVKRAEEYKQAFLETGGTEKEWEEHDIAIKVWYEVKANTDHYLSIAVIGTDNWSSAYSQARYYNLDTTEGRWISFQDIADEAQIQKAEQDVRRQIRQREKETGMEFWDSEWTGIDENTRFYMNSAGNPVIVFEEYEIAPGAAGQQEFEIIIG